MKVSDGNIKTVVYVETNKGKPWIPSIGAEEEILDIPGVVCVDSCGAQTYHVELEFDSPEEYLATYSIIKAQILEIANKRCREKYNSKERDAIEAEQFRRTCGV